MVQIYSPEYNHNGSTWRCCQKIDFNNGDQVAWVQNLGMDGDWVRDTITGIDTITGTPGLSVRQLFALLRALSRNESRIPLLPEPDNTRLIIAYNVQEYECLICKESFDGRLIVRSYPDHLIGGHFVAHFHTEAKTKANQQKDFHCRVSGACHLLRNWFCR